MPSTHSDMRCHLLSSPCQSGPMPCPIQESPAQAQDKATIFLDRDIARLRAAIPAFAQQGSNPPTIIEIAG